MKILVALALAAGLSTANANEEVVVKLKDDAVLQAIPEQARHLFNNIYVIPTKDKSALFEALNGHVVRFYKNNRSEKRELAKRVATPQLTKSLNNFFNDPQINRQWSFRSAAEHGVSVNGAYRKYGKTSVEPTIVAVVDTGVDYRHPDLKNIMWRNPGEISGNGVDDDGNGYVDDVYGIDTLDRRGGVATGDPMDTHDHGTHVSGIIAAEQNNGIGIAGIASNVQIMALRTVPNRGDETDLDVSESFLYAARHGAKIINCSFGKRHNEGGDLVQETIDFIGREHGVLVIAAAGNDGSNIDRRIIYPGGLPNETLLTVASTTSRGGMSWFSNFGIRNVDLGAPGSSIHSTVRGGSYSGMSGTSMASPTAAGIAAEVLSRFPELTPLQLKQVLMSSVVRTGSLNGKVAAHGRADLLKALTAAAEL